ncbi:CopY/TcrY family copper transport repressor [Streptococcus sp. ZJ151]|uniref:CopY/TcrY family copper transport repressor n=1 Tax=Streptococcus jiangjianxini TaxID=3161189 RepID=UPI0032EDE6C1
MPQISNAEWEVMKVVWASKEATSAFIIEVLQQNHDWSDSTIKTMITRLVEKELLASRREGRRFWYRALISEEMGQWTSVSDTFSKICVTNHKLLIERLLLDTPMTLRDIADLEKLLDTKKSEAVDKVICQCLPGQCSCHRH